jgi:hypothetical protein
MNRCYLRGLSWLGLFNTICGCLIGHVLVRIRDEDSGEIVDWRWDNASLWEVTNE